jgi:hypothetical protein
MTRRERIAARIDGREIPLEHRRPRPRWRRIAADVAVWVAALPLLAAITAGALYYLLGVLANWSRIAVAVTALSAIVAILTPVARWADRRIAAWRPHWTPQQRRNHIIGALFVVAFVGGQVWLYR